MTIEVSIGELVDKVSILSIKLDRIQNKEKQKNIKKEYEHLTREMEKVGIKTDSDDFIKLKKVNLRLWNIEDEIRKKEVKKEFNDEFINLARSIYYENDKRFVIKKSINMKYNSELIEEKEYVDYKNT